MRRSIATLGTAAAACALLLGACSSSSNTSSPPPPRKGIEAVYANTVAAKTARMSLNVSVSGGSGADQATFQLTGSGLVDMTDNVAEFNMQLPQTGGGIEERVVGGTVYIKVPPSLSGSLGGKPWASISLSQLANQSGLGSLPGVGTGSDPSQILNFLQGVSSSVTKVGPAEVNGVSTVEYRATIDLSKLAGANPQAGHVLSQAANLLHLHSIPLEVFVDSSGRLRRMVLDMSIDLGAVLGPTGSSSAPASPIELKMTVDLSDFGVPVNVVAPPAGEVAPLPSDLLSGSGSSSLFGSGA